MDDGRQTKVFWMVCAVGMLTRLGVIWVYAATGHADPALPDEVQYWDMAHSLADGEGLMDEFGYRATRMPVFPGFCSLFVGLENGRLIALSVQGILGALACGFTACLGAQVVPPANKLQVSMLAGLLVAFDPFLVYFSKLLLTESLFICALCAALCVAWRTTRSEIACGWFRWIVSGVLFGLCIYLRPSSAGLVVCWCLFTLVRRRLDRAGLAGVCGLAATVMFLLLPWAARNQSVLGERIWLTTRAGISLYDGVRPGADGTSDLAAIKDTGQGELEWNETFKARARREIRDQPGRILRLAGLKFLRTWNLWPNAQGYRSVWIKVIAGTWTIVVLASAVCGIRALWRSKATMVGLLLPAAYFTALHIVFVGSVRYRLPAMPMLEVLAAWGIIWILVRSRGSDSHLTKAAGRDE